MLILYKRQDCMFFASWLFVSMVDVWKGAVEMKL